MNKLQNVIKVYLLLFLLLCNFRIRNCNLSFSEREHKTSGALENFVQLWCYKCRSEIDGPNCITLGKNRTNFIEKCPRNTTSCIVKKIAMTVNYTVNRNLWNLERKCTSINCESGCLSIGERTKLHSCISCCNSSLCNTNSRSEKQYLPNPYYVLTTIFLKIIVLFFVII